MLPDDSGDEEDLAVAGQQQSSEEQAELEGPALQPTHRPEERQHAAAERHQLYTTRTDVFNHKCLEIFSIKEHFWLLLFIYLYIFNILPTKQ